MEFGSALLPGSRVKKRAGAAPGLGADSPDRGGTVPIVSTGSVGIYHSEVVNGFRRDYHTSHALGNSFRALGHGCRSSVTLCSNIRQISPA